ncbi:MAG: putative O-glycosylation ligase, exosortase A system-associated [Casimicrobiaceae bacterium]
MRDYVLTAFIFATIPFILMRPWIGALVWTWIGLMNPHRLTWDFAFTMPFALVVAIATFIGMFFSREKLRIPWTPSVVLLLLLVAWVSLTTWFAIDPVLARVQWEKVMKIELMTFVTLMLITDRQRLLALVAVAALSLGFYGVKGGIFTAMSGGGSQVLGPEGSFIEGNTEIGLAMIMALPLIRVVQLNVQGRLLRFALGASMVLTGLAILGTQSRGAILGAGAMALMLLLKSRQKLLLLLALVAVIPALLFLMPTSWYERMDTIGSYDQDRSAMDRIYAWEFATRMAMNRSLGGGFESFTPENYAIYLPERPEAVNEQGAVADAHSIYFQMLGHHGFVGLALFLALLATIWRSARKVLRETRGRDDLRWANDIAAMTQVSLVGYMVAGAFLGLAYFDLFYTLAAIVVINQSLVARELAPAKADLSARKRQAERPEPTPL